LVRQTPKQLSEQGHPRYNIRKQKSARVESSDAVVVVSTGGGFVVLVRFAGTGSDKRACCSAGYRARFSLPFLPFQMTRMAGLLGRI